MRGAITSMPRCEERRDVRHEHSWQRWHGQRHASGDGFTDECGKCGARRIDRQIGLEESPDEWVARLVEVFREVRRVLRDDGTLWVEIGDSYAHAAARSAATNGRSNAWTRRKRQ